MHYNRKELRMSAHGRHRAKNRAFRPQVIRAILDFGDHYFAGEGSTAVFVGRREVACARKRGMRLDHLANRAVILGPNDVVVTVVHIYRLPRHWRRA